MTSFSVKHEDFTHMCTRFCIENDVKSWSGDAWRFLLRSAPEITATQHTEHSLTVGGYLQDESRSVQCPQTTGGVSLPVTSGRLCVWLWHFGCGEQSVKWSRPVRQSAVSRFYQARGEDSLGLLGFSGVWVSLRALCRAQTRILYDFGFI